MNIIQIGCNDGKDHVLDFVKASSDTISKLILIDASEDALNQCKLTYSKYNNCEFIHAAVVNNNDTTVLFYVPEQDSVSAHSSLNRNHLIKHNHYKICEISVPAININRLLDQYSPVNRLYIDTEGTDSQLVSSIDFTKHKVPYIFFEYVHSDGAFNVGVNFLKCKEILLLNNYQLSVVDTNIVASLT